MDGEVDIRTVEAADDDCRVAHGEPLEDLCPDRGSCRRRQREGRRMAELLDDRAEPKIVRAEVMAPLADAVRLVDDKKLRLRIEQAISRLLVRELLGGEEQELDLVFDDLLEQLLAGALPERGIERGSLAQVGLLDRFHLVTLKREERRDNDGGATPDRGRKLVDGRLPGAGGQHRQRVAAVQHRADSFVLTGAKRVEAEMLPRDLGNGRRSHVSLLYVVAAAKPELTQAACIGGCGASRIASSSASSRKASSVVPPFPFWTAAWLRATSIARLSRMTVTFTCPGYSS